jgi:hypothetical protein
MTRWVRELLSLSYCGGFVLMVWQAAFLVT